MTKQRDRTDHGPLPLQAATLTRREAIRNVSLMLGGALLFGCKRTEDVEAVVEKAAGALPDGPIGQFSLQDIAYLDEIAETIVPTTATPGAKAAKVGAFLALMVTDCYSPDDQKTFRSGMQRIERATQKAAKVGFMQASPQQRFDLLSAFDRQAHREASAAQAEARKQQGLEPLPYDVGSEKDDLIEADSEPAAFFTQIKQLVFLGYFTSEIGCTQAMRYSEVPGRYDPCVEYVAGTPAWAAHA